MESGSEREDWEGREGGTEGRQGGRDGGKRGQETHVAGLMLADVAQLLHHVVVLGGREAGRSVSQRLSQVSLIVTDTPHL